MRLCLCLLIGAYITSIGSGQGHFKVVCYGDDFSMPTEFIMDGRVSTVYFTPTNPMGPSRLVMHKGKVMDQRYEQHFNTTLYASNVTKKDQGTFSISFDVKKERLLPFLRLSVSDCSIKENKYYGEDISMRIFRNASILSFSPLDKPDELSVLWQRNGQRVTMVGKGKVKRDHWVIKQVTQRHSGYYNFRTNEGKMSQRYRVRVSANSSTIHKYTGEDLIVDIPLSQDFVSIDFYPSNHDSRVQVIKNGELMIWRPEGNIWLDGTEDTQFFIENLQLDQSGIYMVHDSSGNLVCKFELLVVLTPPQALHISTIVSAVVLVVCCCCCCRKCCCGNSAAKLDSPACETPEPAVYYHDENGQPPLPTYTVEPRPGTIISGPINSGQPSGPTNPGQPSAPAYPGQPSAPAYPGQPSAPAYAGKPGPTNPGQPSEPTNPGHPSGPTNPSQPSGPADPGQPSGPVYPGQPYGPACPGQPSGPAYPGQPSGPAYPGQPSGPAYPGQPLGPTHSGEVFGPASASVFPIQPTTTYLGPLSSAGEDAAPTVSLGYDCLSYDSGYQYELKGQNVSSAPPLTSDIHSCDVYNSSKLNFR